MKIMYYELIKMLIDYERRNHPETYDATKTVGDHIDFEFRFYDHRDFEFIIFQNILHQNNCEGGKN